MLLRPALIEDESTDASLRNVEFFSEVCLRDSAHRVAFFDVRNLYVRYFNKWMVIARETRNFYSAFVARVTHVVSLITTKKVVWIEAWRVVAFMKNEVSFFNRAMHTFVDETMDSYCSAAIAKDAVAVISGCFFPHPAWNYVGQVYARQNAQKRFLFVFFRIWYPFASHGVKITTHNGVCK